VCCFVGSWGCFCGGLGFGEVIGVLFGFFVGSSVF